MSRIEYCRSEILTHAIKDTKEWSAPPNVPSYDKKRSDQHWIDIFSKEKVNKLSEEDVREFFATFRLHRHSWDYDKVLSLVKVFSKTQNFDPVVDIPSFAIKLKVANKLQRTATSAASKLANFIFPNDHVYIWDTLAREAVNSRFKNDKQDKDYASFHQACEKILKEEQQQPDFQHAVKELDYFFQNQAGPLANRSKISINYIERRLLDKFLWAEGEFLKRK